MKTLLLLIFAFSIACAGFTVFESENESFIQGKWRLAGDFEDKGDATRSWLLEWEFKNGTFVQTGYPPIEQKGKYRIKSDADNKLVLTLYDQDGTFGNKDSDLEIEIDREKKELKIGGRSGFSKITRAKK